MIVFIGGYFGTREDVLPIRKGLEAVGHTVVARWLDETPVATPEATHWGKLAVEDLLDVRAAQIFVLDTRTMTPRGGREVELGVALERGMPVYIVGPQRNVYHYLARAVFATVDDFLLFVQGGGLGPRP